MVKREYIDKDRSKVRRIYYDILEIIDDLDRKVVEEELRKLIEIDADFLDPYLILYGIYRENGEQIEAEKILDDAYNRAIKIITDKNGNWPDILEWSWLENRHIIRTILNKAISLWDNENTYETLDLLRKLLKTNPYDNIGARNYILAIRLGMTLEEFENRFDRGGYYDSELSDWFDENYNKFPDEFKWWKKKVEYEEESY